MSMNEVIEKNASSFARAGYIIVFFGMLTQGNRKSYAEYI